MNTRITHKNAERAEQGTDLAHLAPKTTAAAQKMPMSQTDQVALARRLRHGDRTAAEELVEIYYTRIYLFMRAMGHDTQIGEDLTQETFMRAWNHIGQLREGRALAGWLFRIAGNVSRLHWRKHKHESGSHGDDVERTAGESDGLAQAGEREMFARLHHEVARLPWKLRQAIVLHYLDQLTIAEAAEAAQVLPGTFKSRLNRGLEALRKQIVDE